MKHKQSKKTIAFIIGLIVIFGGIFFAIFVFMTADKQPLVLLYKNESESAIAKQITAFTIPQSKNKHKKFTVKVLDSKLQLQGQLKKYPKADVIITSTQNSLLPITSSLLALDAYKPKLTGNVPATLTHIVQGKTSLLAIPLLLDNMEILYSNQLFTKYNPNKNRTLEDFIETGMLIKKAEPNMYIFTAAGGDDAFLVDFVGALTEAIAGVEAVKNLYQLANKIPIEQNLLADQKNPVSLKTVLDLLRNLKKQGLLHPEWYTLTLYDIEAQIDSKSVFAAFTRLSDHRKIESRNVSAYTSLFFPGSKKLTGRSLTMNAYTGAVLLNSTHKEEAVQLLSYLVGIDAQKQLGDSTGLIPVNTSTQTLDVQAANGRLWASAAQNILGSFSSLLDNSEHQTASLASKIRIYLQSDGQVWK